MPTRHIMSPIFDWFKRRFHRWYEPDEKTKELLVSLAKPEQTEISCEEVFAVLDQFADAVQRGENVLLLMPLIRQHLDVCPNCREEYETLLRMLQPRSDE